MTRKSHKLNSRLFGCGMIAFSSHFCRLESVPIMTVNGGTLPLDLLGTRSMHTKSKSVEDS